jgi:hypothetical protein
MITDVVCLNSKQARKDKADHEIITEKLNRVNDDVSVKVIHENGYQHIPRKEAVVGVW